MHKVCFGDHKDIGAFALFSKVQGAEGGIVHTVYVVETVSYKGEGASLGRQVCFEVETTEQEIDKYTHTAVARVTADSGAWIRT